MARKTTELDVIESMYDLRSSDEDWLRGISEKICRNLETGLGAVVARWSVCSDGATVRQSYHVGVPAGSEAFTDQLFSQLESSPDVTERPFDFPLVSLSETIPHDHPFRRAFLASLGSFRSRTACPFAPSTRRRTSSR